MRASISEEKSNHARARKLNHRKKIAEAFFGNKKALCTIVFVSEFWGQCFVQIGTMMRYRQGKHQKLNSLIDDPNIWKAVMTILRSVRVETIDAFSSERISEQLHTFQEFCPSSSVNISERTIWRWLHWLGFKLEERKKELYIDCHERPDILAYRKELGNTIVFIRIGFLSGFSKVWSVPK